MAEMDYRDTTNLLNSAETSYQDDDRVADHKDASSHVGSFSSSSDTSPPSFLPDDFRDQPHIANLSSLPPDEKPKIKTIKDLHTYDRMYYYYQSEDGQHIYLHPLDIRVLKQEFGSYDHFPNEITVRVVGVDESTMTEVSFIFFFIKKNSYLF